MLGNVVIEKRDDLHKINTISQEQVVIQQDYLIVEKANQEVDDHEGTMLVMQIEAVEVIMDTYQDFIGVGANWEVPKPDLVHAAIP